MKSSRRHLAYFSLFFIRSSKRVNYKYLCLRKRIFRFVKLHFSNHATNAMFFPTGLGRLQPEFAVQRAGVEQLLQLVRQPGAEPTKLERLLQLQQWEQWQQHPAQVGRAGAKHVLLVYTHREAGGGRHCQLTTVGGPPASPILLPSIAARQLSDCVHQGRPVNRRPCETSGSSNGVFPMAQSEGSAPSPSRVHSASRHS